MLCQAESQELAAFCRHMELISPKAMAFATWPVGKQSCRIDKKPWAARWGFLDPLCQQAVDLLPGTANKLGGCRSDIRHPNSYSWDTQTVAQLMQGPERLHDLVGLPLIVLSVKTENVIDACSNDDQAHRRRALLRSQKGPQAGPCALLNVAQRFVIPSGS